MCQILMGDDSGGWKLVTLDDHKKGRLAPEICQRILRSAWFRMITMMVILSNGVCMATMNFKHDERPREDFYEHYYYIEVIHTISCFFLSGVKVLGTLVYSLPNYFFLSSALQYF